MTAVKISYALLFIFLLSNVALAQDYQKLERAADAVKDAAERVADDAGDQFQKGRQNSSDAIEHAFLAEEAYAAAKLMDKIVGDKYDIGDLRLAANVLKVMSERFPAGEFWSRLRESIDSLVFELAAGGGPTGPVVPPPNGDPDDDFDENRILGRFFWNGEVDHEVHLSVNGTSITSETLRGRRLEDGSFSFTAALPRESGLIVGVTKTDGRGQVTVIQQPNAANDFTAIIRLFDDDGGARPYSIEIFWYKGSEN
ncbi:MAG: hypothetical protein DWQ47_01345 [Acidobacteria bacterium]|nr:MAG: hypothetical protein DWQ32_11805 [Acidobacteriota bacterium]REK04145.1 MAG: hypothetical protein DWQ38_01330 [Acidobacteriota bacterium]REK15307.1 MAG: hypothetical protein DWQ43_17495 [Acidobacteriota bacterium]REK46397.1 MAG: hypothetical protein DWQ47_01345 [Acidobacteriota bacterium]